MVIKIGVGVRRGSDLPNMSHPQTSLRVPPVAWGFDLLCLTPKTSLRVPPVDTRSEQDNVGFLVRHRRTAENRPTVIRLQDDVVVCVAANWLRLVILHYQLHSVLPRSSWEFLLLYKWIDAVITVEIVGNLGAGWGGSKPTASGWGTEGIERSVWAI